jgi:hypothetical protein
MSQPSATQEQGSNPASSPSIASASATDWAAAVQSLKGPIPVKSLLAAGAGPANGKSAPGLAEAAGANISGLARAAAASGGAVAGGEAAAAVGGVGALASGAATGGPLGILTVGAFLTGKELTNLIPKMADFGKNLSDSNRSLAQFSPSMSMVEGQAQLREAMRGMKSGERTAGTAGFFENAWQGMKDDVGEIVTLLRNIANIVGGIVVWLGRFILGPLTLIAKGINKLVELASGDTSEGEPILFSQWLKDVADETKQMKERNDPRFQRPQGKR